MNWLASSIGSSAPSKRRTRTRLRPRRWGSLAEFEISRLPAPKRSRSSGSSASKRSFSSRGEVLAGLEGDGEVAALDQRAGVDAVRGAAWRPRPRRRPRRGRPRARRASGRRCSSQPLVEVQLQGLAGDVEVDLGEHVVARHHQRLEGVDAPLLDADPPLAGLAGPRSAAWCRAAARGRSCRSARRRRGCRAAGSPSCRRRARRRRSWRSSRSVRAAAPCEQAHDVGRRRGRRRGGRRAPRSRALCEQPPGHLLVVDAALEQLLGGVAERRVPEVVEEGRGAHQPALAGCAAPAGSRPAPLLRAAGRRRPARRGAWRRGRGRSGCARRRGRPGR